MKSYLYKLIPPRPDFAQSMTPAEAEIMRAHLAYWTAMLNEGKAVAFGPVADPKGGYGVGMVRLDNDTDPSSLSQNDPAIKAGIGFKSELYLMPQLVSKV
jgi:uncharacterized protein YciI